MALQKPYADPFGNINQEAYHKIIQTNIDWIQKKAYIVLGIYKDRKARDEGKQLCGAIEQIFPAEIEIGTPEMPVKKQIPFDTFFGVNAKGKNVAEQTYLAFKELPAFKDAVDI